MTINNRQIAWFINIVGAITTLILAWQVVRFCLGEIGAPLADCAVTILKTIQPLPNSGELRSFLELCLKGIYFITGISMWFIAAIIVKNWSGVLARIVEVGYTQYKLEVDQAAAEHKRLQEIERSRSIRQLVQRKSRVVTDDKSLIVFVTIFIGIIILSLF
jgi:hypothetical protein